MRQIIYVGAFWIVVIITIRLAVCFPRSLLARVLFEEIGPMRKRGESSSNYLLRWARFGISCFMQAALIFVTGCGMLEWDPSLFDSLVFAVLWAVVVPTLGVSALLVAVG